MGEQITMTLDEFERFHKDTVKLAVTEAIKTFKKENSKESIRKREIKALRNKLASYRTHVKTMQEDIDFTEAEKFEYRLQFLEDLMDVRSMNSERTEEILVAREEKRRMIGYELATIDLAVKKMYEEVEKSDDSERARWFNVMVMFYINDEHKTMDEVAEALNISRATAWRDLDKACGALLEYIV